MTKYFFVALVSILTFNIFAQNKDTRTLFTVAGDKVTVSEFESVYNKNNVNNQADYSEKSLRDYLNLYQNFRLKVKEAEALQLDTISSLKTELEGYRKQLAKTYLTDREISDKLIQEAYDRSTIEINCSHVLVKCSEDANPADTLAAYKKILAYRTRLIRKEDFGKIARETADQNIGDPSAKTNDGNIGWFTAFGTIYPFETAAYNLKPGEISQPVRTPYGYHIVRVNETRPARGSMHTAQLMLRFTDSTTAQQKAALGKKIDSIYNLISSGKITFEDGVKDFSEDKTSKSKNGELPWIGTNGSARMVTEYEDAAFALTKDGEISKPFQTKYGWHIVKRLEKKDNPPFNEVKGDIKKKVERDTRSQVAKTKLIDRIKAENGFVQFTDVRKSFYASVDSTLGIGNWKLDETKRKKDVPLFVLNGKNYTTNDFADYIEKIAKRRTDKNTEGLLNEYYDNFVTQKCLDFEESTLEEKKPEFKSLMREYRDGILLFELMDRKVWSKAVKDTSGLEAFYPQVKSKYMWGNRAEVVIFNCSDKKIADEAYKMIQKNKSVDEVKKKLNVEGSKSKVSTIEGKYEKGQYEVVDKIDWKPGLTPINKLNDSSFQFILVKKIAEPEPKSIKEAKGYIVSDYQEYLEKTWLEELRKKYPVTVDEPTFKSLVKK